MACYFWVDTVLSGGQFVRSTVVLIPVLLAACGNGKSADTASFGPPPVVINELVSSNQTGWCDLCPEDVAVEEDATYPDWIEIHNAGQEAWDVSGWWVSDDLTDPFKFTFPTGTTIPAGGYYLVVADSDPEDGPNHAPFDLRVEGEEVGLFGPDADGNPLIDSIVFPAVGTDYSFGRLPDASADWGVR